MDAAVTTVIVNAVPTFSAAEGSRPPCPDVLPLQRSTSPHSGHPHTFSAAAPPIPIASPVPLRC
eukprot:4092881-Prymnesium_polylepis.1